MAKINVLEKHVAELIAAGEVVERPASIVKELVENAIDAGAASVTVEIKGGGIQYIRITDNGCGIERDDIRNAFVRHATSKVRISEDLSNITTMGFRGEALASVAAMSRVEVLTRTADEVAGTHYCIAGGEEQSLEDAGCPVGTTLTIRDVFYNTPARMKFLKKDVTEGNSVAAAVEKAALSEPGVSFRFIRDGITKFQTPGDGQLLSAVRCVLGSAFAQNALQVSYAYQGLAVDGLVCRPEGARASRSMQNFFINRRFIRSKTCMAALEEAFKGVLMTGKFPTCVLNLTIPPQTVDVNVHPAKIEVRFADEKSIFSLVYYGVKTTLKSHTLAPEMKDETQQPNPFAAEQPPKAPEQTHISAAAYRDMQQMPRTGAPQWPPAASSAVSILEKPKEVLYGTKASSPAMPAQHRPHFLDIETDDEETATQDRRLWADDTAPAPLILNSPSVLMAAENPSAHSFNVSEKYRPLPEVPAGASQPAALFEDAQMIGELFSTYILLQKGNELIFVDKHAAHERLIYNQLMDQGAGHERQILLSPISVRLSAEEYSAVLENLSLLEDAGITAEDFGDGCVIVREAAPVLLHADLSAIVTEFAGKLVRANCRLVPRQMEELYHTMACRAAIKAHDRTELPSLKQLIALLIEDGDATHCPHGRPVAIRINKQELEKKFGRLG